MTLAVAASAGTSVSTPAREKDPRPPAPFPNDPGAAAREAAAAREDARREEERRSTPEAREDRQRSRQAYRDMSPSEAAALAVDRFEALFSLPDRRLLQLRDGERVERYLGANAALVDRGDGNVLVESSMPLRTEDDEGDLAPVDLDLVEDPAGFRTRNSFATTRVARDPRSGASVAGLGSIGLRTASGTQGMRVRNEVFYGDAALDTDMWIKPVPHGAEVAFQLRSEDSPEQLRLDLDLPAGVEPELDRRTGRVRLDKDGEQIGVLGAPAAMDSDGRRVAASLRVVGRDVLIDVPHRDADALYPVVVDPVFEYYDFTTQTPGAAYDPVGWDYFESNPVCNETPTQPPPRCFSFWHLLYTDDSTTDGTNGTRQRGLYIRRNSGGQYADGEYAQYYWTAPRESYIYEARMVGAHLPANSRMALGIWSSRLNPGGNPPGNWETHEKYSVEIPWGWWRFCTHNSTAMPAGETPCNDTVGQGGNQAVIALSAHSPVETWIAEAWLGWAQLWLNDRESPTWTNEGSVPTGWARNHTGTITATARDAGLGIQKVYLDRPVGGTLESPAATCTGGISARCNESETANFNYDTSSWGEGRQTVTLRAKDALQKTAPSKAHVLKIDRTNPSQPTGTGTLPANDDKVVGGSSYDLAVDAADQSNLSGVKDIKIWVDRPDDPPGDVLQTTDGQGNAWSANPDNCEGCNLTRSFRLNTGADGLYKVTVRSYDKADNESAAKVYTLVVDGGDPITTGVTHSGLPSGWFETATITSTVSGTDTGTGIKEGELTFPGGATRRGPNTINPNCSGTPSSPCPNPGSASITYTQADLPEGVSQTSGRVMDAGGRRSQNQETWSTKVDRSPPNAPPGLTGTVATPNAWVAESSSHSLSSVWSDSHSGMKSSEVQLTQSPVADDRFGRNQANGWGRSDDWVEWTPLAGPASAFSVDNERGRIALGTERVTHLPEPAARDIDARALVTFPASTSAEVNGWISTRIQVDGQRADVGLARHSDNSIWLKGRLLSGAQVFTPVDTGLDFVSGGGEQSFNLRLQLEGQTVRARAWSANGAEPTTWPINVAGTSIPSGQGLVGLRTGDGPAGLSMGFDNLKVTRLPEFVSQETSSRSCTADSPPSVDAPNGGCPTTLTHPFTWNNSGYPAGYGEGPYRFKLIGRDPLNHPREHLHPVRLDMGFPWPGHSGRLYDARDTWLASDQSLTLTGYDGAYDGHRSGVRTLEIKDRNNGVESTPRSVTDACSSECPSAKTTDWTFSRELLGDGYHTITPIAIDRVGHRSDWFPFTVKNDRQLPRIPDRSGTLPAADGRAVRGSSFSLTTRATDGTTASPSSGVRQTKLFAGPIGTLGNLAERSASAPQSPGGDNAEQSWTASFAPSSADETREPRRIRVQASDQVNNTSATPPTFQGQGRVGFWRLDEPGPGPQLVQNPGFEADTAGWTISRGAFWNLTTSLTRHADGGHSGSGYGRVVTPGRNAWEGPVYQLSGPFKKNVRYTVSVWVRGVSGSGNVGPTLGATSSDNGGTGTPITSSTGWTQVTSSWTPVVQTGVAYLAISTRSTSQALTFDFDDVEVYESGTSAKDASQAHNSGAYANGPTLGEPGATTDGNAAVRFNGSNHVSVPDAGSLDLGDNLSISAWFRRSASGDQYIVGKGTNAYVLRVHGGRLALRKGDSATVVQSTVNAPGADGRWHHVVATKSPTAARIYLDGVDVSGTVTNQTLENNTEPLHLGSNQGATADRWNGWLDDVSVYNRALSEGEARTLYTPEPADWRIGDWRMNEVVGSTAADSAPQRELVTNPGFESDLNGWQNIGMPNMVRTFGPLRSGTYGLQLGSDGAGDRVQWNTGALVAGRRYTFSTWVLLESSTTDQIHLQVADNAGSGPGVFTSPDGSISSTGRWRRLSVSFVAASSTQHQLQVRQNGAGTATWYIDDASLKEDNAGTYSGGHALNQPGAGGSADRAVDLNGTSGHVDLPFAHNPASAFSIEAWVKLDAPGVDPAIVSQRDGTGVGRTLLFVRTSNGHFASNLGGTVRDSNFTAQVGQYHHVVFTYAAGNTRDWAFYVDGVRTASGTATAENATGGWLLGTNKTRNGSFWNGPIDDVAVYGHALPAADVSRLHGEHAYDWNVVFDNGAPTVWHSGTTDNAWYDGSAHLQVALNAQDGVSGVKRRWVYTPKQGGGENAVVDEDQNCSDAIALLCPLRPPSRTVAYDTADMPEGSSNTVRAVSEDAVGNLSSQVQWNVKVDKSPPSVPQAGGDMGTDGGWIGPEDTTLSASASDTLSGVRSIEFQVDGVRQGDPVQASCGTDCPPFLGADFEWDHTNATAGSHTLKLIATDGVGHTSERTWTVRIDGTEPSAAIGGDLWGLDGDFVGEPVQLEVEGFDGEDVSPESGIDRVEIVAGGQTFTFSGGGETTWTLDPDDYPEGRLLITVRVIDLAGNVRSEPLTVYIRHFDENTPQTIDLSTNTALHIIGASAGDAAGHSVATLGDVDGDDLTDYAVGAPDADGPAGQDAGAVYVVWGRADATSIDLAQVHDNADGTPGSLGFRVDGATLGDHAGTSVAAGGDVNGDGLTDLLVGAPKTLPALPGVTVNPYVAVVFGRSRAQSGDVQLGNLGGNGFMVNATVLSPSPSVGSYPPAPFGSRLAGPAVGEQHSPGDVNGDGLDDFVIGSSTEARTGLDSGSAYVVFGRAGTAPVNLGTDTGWGYRIDGPAGERLGYSVALPGDVDGDGRADVLAGAPGHVEPGRTNAGAAYVVKGKDDTQTVDVAAGSGGQSRAVVGRDSDRLGYSVSGLGDVDGDYVEDYAVGGHNAYALYGRSGTDPIDTNSVALPEAGWRMVAPGPGAEYDTGVVSRVGDIDADGRPDVSVGYPDAANQRIGNGRSFTVMSRPMRFAQVDLANLEANHGSELIGAGNGDRSGTSSAAVDDTGDGNGGQVSGSPGASRPDGSTQAGAARVTRTPAFRSEVRGVGVKDPKFFPKRCYPRGTTAYKWPRDYITTDNDEFSTPPCRKTAYARTGSRRYYEIPPKRVKNPNDRFYTAQNARRPNFRLIAPGKHALRDSFGRAFAYLENGNPDETEPAARGSRNIWTVYRAAGPDGSQVGEVVGRTRDPRSPDLKRGWELMMQGKQCMSTEQLENANTMVVLKIRDPKGAPPAPSEDVGNPGVGPDGTTRLDLGIRGFISYDALPEASYMTPRERNAGHSVRRASNNAYVGCGKRRHYRDEESRDIDANGIGPLGFNRDERHQGSGSADRCAEAGTKAEDCGGTYYNYERPIINDFDVLIPATSSPAVDGGGIAVAIVRDTTPFRELDRIGYVDEAVPCTRQYVAQWVFGDFNPGGSRRIYGWLPTRQETGRFRTDGC